MATVKLWCWAISSPRSQVNERRRKLADVLAQSGALAVSLLGTWTSMTKRERRSTKVAT